MKTDEKFNQNEIWSLFNFNLKFSAHPRFKSFHINDH